MKILKRILFTILGLLLVSSVSLVGIILYAEYSGQRFWKDSETETADAGFADTESRLAYDENGNIAELPGTSFSQSEQTVSETQSNPGSSSAPAPDFSDPDMPDESTAGTDVSAPASGTDNNNTADTTAVTSSLDEASSGSEGEQLYIMDMDSGLFHTGNCTDVPDISQDSRSERTTSRDKILDAGYSPCPHCNP